MNIYLNLALWLLSSLIGPAILVLLALVVWAVQKLIQRRKASLKRSNKQIKGRIKR